MMNWSDDKTMDLNCSENWNKYTFLQSIRHLIDFRGRTPLKIGMQWGGEILSLSANNVRDGYIDFETDAHYGSEELYKKWMTKGDCKKGDIIFTMEAPLGNVAQIPDNKQYILSQRVVLLKTNNNIIENSFLSYLMRGDEFQKELIQKSTGSTVTGIQQKKLNKFEFLIPPIKQQQKIAQILSTIDNLIGKTQILINKYTAIKQGMMADLFSRGIDLSDTPETNPNYGQLRPKIKDAPELYKKTELGWIPKEWKVQSLDEFTKKITSGSRDWASYYSDEGDLFVRISNLTREHINFRWQSVKYVNVGNGSEGERTRLEAGDILISITADLGIIGVVPEGFGRSFINQHTALLRLNKDVVNTRFIGNFLHSFAGQDQFEKLNDSGAKAGLNLPTVAAIKCVIPSIEEQNKISEIIDQVDKKITCLKTEKDKYIKIKKGLMQDLLTGKVEVR